jgi:hypothetical protein
MLCVVVFWVVTPRSLVGGYQHLGEINYLHLRGINGPISLYIKSVRQL